MTTPKEALELALSVMQDAPKSVLRDCAIGEVEQVLASLQGEDAVERVAQTIREYCIGVSPASIQLSHGVERIYYAGLPVLELARAILATGLVPDEAAIRAATSDMLLAGARSLGNTMGKPNFMQRAQACWDAMWKAKDGVVEPKPAAIRSGGGE